MYYNYIVTTSDLLHKPTLWSVDNVNVQMFFAEVNLLSERFSMCRTVRDSSGHMAVVCHRACWVQKGNLGLPQTLELLTCLQKKLAKTSHGGNVLLSLP